MAQMYTDRVIISIGGRDIFPPGDIASFSLRKSGNSQFVQGMTTTGDSSGATKGNNTYILDLTHYVQNNQTPYSTDYSKYDYEFNNVQITIAPSTKSFGEHTYDGKIFTLSNVFYMDSVMNGGGQGQPITNAYTFGAISEIEA